MTVMFLRHLKYKKRLLLKCLHHFIPDLINNKDHMRISGTEPSSVKIMHHLTAHAMQDFREVYIFCNT